MLGDEQKKIRQHNLEYSTFLTQEGLRLKEERQKQARDKTEKALKQGLRLGKMSQREADYKMKKIYEFHSRQ